MEKQKISVKQVLEYKDAVSYIEDLAKSFKSGTIVLESGEEHVVMKPSARVAIKVEAKVKNDKQKIGFELSWSEVSDAELKISDSEPAPAPAVRPESAAPVAKEPAMVPAKSEPAKPPVKTEPEPKADAAKGASPKAAPKKSAPKKAAAKKSAAPKRAAKKPAARKTPAKSAGKK